MRIGKTFISSKYYSMLISGTLMSVLNSVLIIAHTLIAGLMLGEDAVTGVNLVLPIYTMASFFAMIFSLGVPILYANELGAFHKEKADRCFGTGLLMAIITGLVLYLVIRSAGEAFLRNFRSGEQAFRYAKDYLTWNKYVVLIMPLQELLYGMVFADGDEKVSTAANLVSGLGNVILSVLLCREMGTKGLGLASFISLAASLLVLFLHFGKKNSSLRLNLTFSYGIFLKAVKYSIVDASTYLFLSLFTMIINYYVADAFGAGPLILVSVMTMVRELQLIFDGIGEAITPIMSVYLGEGTYPGVRETWQLARRSLRIESLIVTVTLLLGAPVIIRFLHIEDAALTRDAVWGLRVLSLTLICTCRMYLDSSYYILVDKIPLGVLVCALRDLIPALPLAMLGGRIGGIRGMFTGLMLAPAAGYGLSVLYVRIKYSRENYPLFLLDREKNKNIFLFEFSVSPEIIVQIRDQIGNLMKDKACSNRLVNRTMLLFEELFMSVYENNPGKTVLAECSVELGESVRLITRDDGEILDLTDTDREIKSLRTYVISNLVGAYTGKRVHFLTLSFNRNAFEIR